MLDESLPPPQGQPQQPPVPPARKRRRIRWWGWLIIIFVVISVGNVIARVNDINHARYQTYSFGYESAVRAAIVGHVGDTSMAGLSPAQECKVITDWMQNFTLQQGMTLEPYLDDYHEGCLDAAEGKPSAHPDVPNPISTPDPS